MNSMDDKSPYQEIENAVNIGVYQNVSRSASHSMLAVECRPGFTTKNDAPKYLACSPGFEEVLTPEWAFYKCECKINST